MLKESDIYFSDKFDTIDKLLTDKKFLDANAEITALINYIENQTFEKFNPESGTDDREVAFT